MSRSLVLVRFDDGTILHGCYHGNSDFVAQKLISEKELGEDYDGSIFKWDDKFGISYTETSEIHDSEDVEIFSDYGNGFVWKGKASKSQQLITSELNAYEINWDENIPDWVTDYFVNRGWDIRHLIRVRPEDRYNAPADVTDDAVIERIISAPFPVLGNMTLLTHHAGHDDDALRHLRQTY